MTHLPASHHNPDAETPKVSPVTPPARSGPGLLEACLWSVGCQLAQLLVLACLSCSLIWLAASRFPPSSTDLLRIIDELGWETSFLFTGATSLASLLLIIPAVRWRLGPGARSVIGLARFTLPQVFLLAAAVAPLAVLSDQVYRWGLSATAWLAQWYPQLEPLLRVDTVHLVQQQAAVTDFPILLVAIAVGPAIGEELVFRGLIGRGLIHRWGAPVGVLLTSLLFAAAHGTPAHALATFPIGLALHFVYLATGNLWGPIALHALVNALAVTLMKYMGETTLPADPAVVCAAGGYLGVLGALLWQSGRAPRSTDVERRPVAPLLRPAVASCSILAYTCVFVWSRLMAV